MWAVTENNYYTNDGLTTKGIIFEVVYVIWRLDKLVIHYNR